MIYFDNAATTGNKPKAVKNAVEYALSSVSANPGRSGHAKSVRAGELVFKSRSKAAQFFGAEPENVAFTYNCTHAINFVIKGVLRNGDHAIISSMEHNAVARPIHKLKTDGIIDYDIAEVIIGDSEATFHSFERLIRPETKLIISIHASNVTGEVMPIKQLAKMCRDRGIFFLVDAAQTAGVLPIDVGETGIDFLAAAPHKGLYAPMGTGLLIARKGIPNTLIEGGTGSFSNMLSQPEDMPDRFESGTVNLPGIMGISAGIDFVGSVGIKAIYSHEISLCKRLYNALSELSGLRIYSSFDTEENAPVFSFNIDGLKSMEVAEMLSKKGFATRAGLHCSPLAHQTLGTIDTGTVRISPSYFNNEREILMLQRAIFDIKKQKNIAKKY